METALLRVPVFPLAGALLFPRSQLPLHIFEPRYRAMVRDALASDRLIAMVQPQGRGASRRPCSKWAASAGSAPATSWRTAASTSCWKGSAASASPARPTVDTLYRQVDADRSGFDEEEDPVLALVQRAEVEREARRYADALGYMVEWE